MPILSTPPAPSATVGGPGPTGPAGQSAYTFTTAPISGYNGTSTLTVSVQNTTWLGVTSPVFIPNVGSFEVTAINTTNNTLNLLPLNVGLATPPISIPSGTMVSATGFPGLNGATGGTGPQGTVGLQGPVGPQGLQGTAGQAGATGPTGPQGATGQQGTQGPPGTTGATGATGPQGPIGVKGDTGNQGIQGVQGPSGPQGVGGPLGATGPQGPQGPPGPAVTAKGAWQPSQIYGQGDLVTWNNLIYIALAGSQNAQPDQHPNLWAVYSSVGVQGPAGATGPVGPPGAQGPQGVVGPQGVPGPDGATGATGPAGSPGPTGNTGPQGAQGATGATGPMGPTGPQGVPGPSVVWRGNWTSAATYNPNDGVSYQGNSYVAISTNSNNPPPSTAWQLIAQQGATGVAGPTGATGATGATGPQGATGTTGATGSQGPAGTPGPTGTAGANSWTLTTATFTVPLLGQTVVVNVMDSSWAVVGEFVWVQSAGGASNIPMALQITAKTPTTVTLLNPPTAGTTPSGDANNLLQVGSDQLLYLPASSVQATVQGKTYFDPASGLYFYDDFCTALTNDPHYVVSASGGTFGIGAYGQGNATLKINGCAELSTGTTSSPNQGVGYYWGGTTAPAAYPILYGLGTLVWKTRIFIEGTLPPTGISYMFRAGIGQMLGTFYGYANNPIQGFFFEYDPTQNSGNWRVAYATAGAATYTNTSVAVAGDTAYNLEIDANAAWTTLTFKINGVVAATLSSGFPTAVNGAVVWAIGRGTGSTTNYKAAIDSWMINSSFTR